MYIVHIFKIVLHLKVKVIFRNKSFKSFLVDRKYATFCQVKKPGIYRDKTMADKLITSPIMIHKIIHSVQYSSWSKRLDTRLNI